MTHATIAKDFEFAASHQLAGLPDDHPCSRLHGHNFVLRVSISGRLDPVGFVIDYRRLWFVKEITEELDHRHLNDVVAFNPTSERMAAWLWERIAGVLRGMDEGPRITHLAVGWSETPKTWATVAGRID